MRRIRGSWVVLGMVALVLSMAPAWTSSARMGARQAATAGTGGELEQLVPASAIAVITVAEIEKYQQALVASTLLSTAKETAAVEPVEAKLDALTLKTGAGLRGAVLMFYDGSSNRGDAFSMAQIVEAASPSTAKSAFERAAGILRTPLESAIDRGGAIVIEHKRGSQPYAIARADRSLVYGPSSAVNEIIGAYKGGKRMWADPQWADSKSGTGSQIIHAFVNVGQGSTQLSGILGANGIIPPQFAQFLDMGLQFLGISALKTVTLTSRSEGGVFEDEVQLGIDWDRSGLLGVLLKPPPLAFQNASSLPPDTRGYLASGVDLTRIYDLVLNTFGPLLAMQMGASSVTSEIQRWESQLGFKIRDELLASLGPEYLISAVPGAAGQTGAAVEDVVGIVEIKNPTLIRTAVQKLMALNHGPDYKVVTEAYKDAQLMKLDPDLSLGILESAVYIGEPGPIKRLLDLRSNSPSGGAVPAWLASLRPVTAGRSMELKVSREGCRWSVWRNLLGPAGAGSMADLLSKRLPYLAEGTASANGRGLTLVARTPIGAITGFEISARESPATSAAGGTGDAKGGAQFETGITGLIQLARLFTVER